MCRRVSAPPQPAQAPVPTARRQPPARGRPARSHGPLAAAATSGERRSKSDRSGREGETDRERGEAASGLPTARTRSPLPTPPPPVPVKAPASRHPSPPVPSPACPRSPPHSPNRVRAARHPHLPPLLPPSPEGGGRLAAPLPPAPSRMNGAGGGGLQAPPRFASLNESPGGRRPAPASPHHPRSARLASVSVEPPRRVRSAGAATAGPRAGRAPSRVRCSSLRPHPPSLSFRKHRAVVPSSAPAPPSGSGLWEKEQQPPGRAERRSRRPGRAGPGGVSAPRPGGQGRDPAGSARLSSTASSAELRRPLSSCPAPAAPRKRRGSRFHAVPQQMPLPRSLNFPRRLGTPTFPAGEAKPTPGFQPPSVQSPPRQGGTGSFWGSATHPGRSRREPR